jgi:RNA polymerase sigma-70 factor (ECF subfamily)
LNDPKREFELAVMIHLDAAYNLAHWLVRDASAAEDVAQESLLRAFRYFKGFRGGDARPWLMGIVRNSAYTWLRERGVVTHAETSDDDIAQESKWEAPAQDGPENMLIRKTEAAQINSAIAALPPQFREVIVLRVMEEMSYEAIATVAHVPVGTVMSRLSRARALLRQALINDVGGDRYGQ